MRGSLCSIVCAAILGTIACPITAFAQWIPLPAPKPSTAPSHTLWATFYHIYEAKSQRSGEPLYDRNGNSLGPILSHWDWCKSALQGTVQVAGVTYNFASRGDTLQVDCQDVFPKVGRSVIEKVGKVRFEVSRAPFGYGTQGLHLVPFRTIAVDRTKIPIGSVLYIPQARGVRIQLPSGERVIHDGYFYAADVGSAIQGNHIDVFIGTAQRNPFEFVTSKPNGIFSAWIVSDRAIVETLQTLHQSR